MMMPGQPRKEQSGKRSSKIGTAHKSKTKKRREVKGWQEEDQMAAQCDEEQKWEEILERRRMERNSLQLEVMQKVPELVVQEPPTKGKKGRAQKKRRKRKDGLLKK